MQAVSRLLRIGGIVLVLLLIVIAIAAAGLYGYLRSDAGRGRIAALAGDLLSTPEGTRISVGQIDGDLFGHFALTDIVLADPRGQWGQVDRIEAVWHPGALAHRLLHVEALAIDGVDITRQPVSPPQPEQEPQQAFEMPHLPVAVHLDSLRVSDVTLGEALLGERMRLAGEGAAALEREGNAQIALDLARIDAESDRLHLKADYAPGPDGLAAGSLNLAARLDGPAGGLASRLLGLSPQPAVTAEITGSGPLLAWNGKLALDITDVVALDARFDGAEDQPLAVRLRGDAHFGPLAPNLLRESAGSNFAFGADLSRPEPDLIVIEQVGLTSDRLRLAASGRLREMNRLENVRLTLTAERAALAGLAAPAEIGALTLEAQASGPIAQPEVAAQASLTDLRMEGTGSAARLVLSLHGGATEEQGGAMPLALTGTAEGLSFAEARLNGLIGPRLTLRAEGSIDPKAGAARLDALRLAGAATRVTAEGRFAAATQDVAAKLRVELPDLAAADPTLAGAARLDADVAGDLTARGVVAEITGRISDLETGQEAVHATLGRDLNLSAKAAYDPSGRARLDHLTLTGADTRIAAEGCVYDPSGPLACDIGLRIGDLAALAPLLGADIAGALTAQAKIGGSAAAPAVAAEAALREGRIRGQRIDSLTFAAQGTDLLSAPEASIEAHLRGPSGPIDLSAGIASPADAPAGTIGLRDLQLTGPGLDGRARLTLTRAPMTLAGEVTLDLDSFAALAPFVAAAPSGSARLEASFDQHQGTQHARFTLHGDDLVLPGAAEPALTLDALRLAGTLSGLFAATPPRIDATLAVTGAGTPAATLTRLEGGVTGALDDLSLRAEASGAAGAPFTVSTRARIARGPTTTITVQDLKGKVADRPLRLMRAASLALGGDGIALSGLDLRLARSARLVAEGRLGANALELHATANDVPLDLLALVRPDLALEGEIDLKADLASTPDRRSGNLAVSARGVRLAEVDADLVPALAAELRGNWNGSIAQLTGTVSGLSSEPARLSASLPLRVQEAGPLPSPVETAPIAATLDWTGPIAPLWHLVPLPEHQLSGQAQIAARLGGTLAAPEISGRLSLKDGSYENLAFGTRLDDLTVAAVAERRDALTLRLSASDGGRGRLSGQGRIDLDPAGGFATDIRVALAEMRLVDRDDVDGRVSGDLALAGDLSALRLGGHLRTKGVNISLDRTLPPAVAELDVVEAGSPEAAALLGKQPVPAAADTPEAPTPAREPQPAGPQIALDLTVNFPRQVFVRGRGLDTEWEGKLAVGGTAEAPRIRGQLDLVRGDFTFAGQRLDLDRGVVTFTGGTQIDPVLDIVAVYAAEKLTARIAVTGTASDPEITLSSTPELPQDEILAQILYGKSAAGLSPLEALQLARAVASLTGSGPQGPGLLARTRSALGLDVLRFSGGEEGTGPTVDVGKYVTDNVYVGVEQGVQQGSGAVTVEIELTPRISVETDVGATNNRVGLNWKYDY